MAATLKYTVTLTANDNVVDLIEIYQEGSHTPAALTPGFPFLLERYANSGGLLGDLVLPTEHEFRVIASGSTLTDLETIRKATHGDWTIIHYRGGVDPWYGEIIGEFMSFEINPDDEVTTVVFVARDRLLSLDRQDYVDGSGDTITGIAPFRETIGAMLIATGINAGAGLAFIDESTAKDTAETGDPLDHQYNRERWYQQGEEDALPVYADKQQVLEQSLRSFMLRAMQYRGKIYLSQPTSHLAATVTQRTYNAAGTTKTGTATPASFIDLDSTVIDVFNYIEGSDRLTGASERYAEASITYDPGPFGRGNRFNLNFSVWPNGANDVPDGWTYAGSSSDILRFGEFFGTQQGHSAGILNKTFTPADPTGDGTLAEQKAAVTEFMSHSLGEFLSGATEQQLRFAHAFSYDPAEDQTLIGLFQLQGFLRIRLVGASNTYYWQASAVPHEGTFEIITGDAAKHPLVNLTTLETPIWDFINILDFPVSGELFIDLGTVARPSRALVESGSDDVYCRWGNIELEALGAATTGEASITYRELDSTVSQGEAYKETVALGQGPSGALGAIYRSDGTTLAANFQYKAGAPTEVHTKMLARHKMITQRGGRDLIEFKTIGALTEANAPTPVRAFDVGSTRFWPLFMEIERPSCHRRVIGEEILEDTGSTTSDNGSGGPGAFAFAGGGGRVFTDLLGRIVNTLIQSDITTTSATILAGNRTSATIVPVSSKFAKSGEVLTFIDRIQHTIVNATLSADYVASSTTLAFNSVNFKHDFTAGAFVFNDAATALALLIFTEAGLSVVVRARELTKFKLAVTGTQTNLSSSQIDPLNYEILDQTPLKTTLADGTVLEYFANGQQAAAKNNLDIELTAGVGNAVDFGTTGAAVGASLPLADDRDLVPTKLNVFFSGIEFQAKLIKSTSWNGTADANGVITDPGTIGWAVTGVDGQPSDAAFTGTLNAGAGAVRIGGSGIEIVKGGVGGGTGSVDWLNSFGGTVAASIFVASSDTLTLNATAGNVDIAALGSNAIDLSAVLGVRIQVGYLRMREQPTPSTPQAGHFSVYPKTDGKFYGLNDAGTEYDLTATGGATSITNDVIPKGTGSGIEDSNWSITDAGILSSVAAGAQIGIGTATPNFPLHLYRNSSLASQIKIEQDGTGDVKIQFLLSGIRAWEIGIDNSDLDKFKFAPIVDNFASVVMTIDTSGNVGIGTAVPGEKLHVAGNSVLAGYVDIQEQSPAPSTPATGFVRLWAFTTQSGLYYEDDGGTTRGLMVHSSTVPADETITVADGASGIRYKSTGVSIVSNQVRTTGGYLATSTGYFAIATGGVGTDETQYKAGQIILEGQGDFFFLKQERTGGGTATQIQSDPDGALSLGYDGTPFKIETALYGGVVNGQWHVDGLGNTVLTGTIDPIASVTVTGVGTLFQTELIIGDRLLVTGETRTVVAIASNTSLTVNVAFSDNANDTSPEKVPAGLVVLDGSDNINFSVSSRGDLNIAGYLEIEEISAPGAPATNRGRLYNKTGSTAIFWHHGDGGGEVNLIDAGTTFALADDVEGTFGDVPDATIQWENTGLDWEFNLKTQGEIHFLHNAEMMALMQADGSVILYHDNAQKFSTESGGVVVTGNTETTRVVVGDGTEAAPSMTFLTETNWGYYVSAPNVLGFSANGAQIIGITPTQYEFKDVVTVKLFTVNIDNSAAGTDFRMILNKDLEFTESGGNTVMVLDESAQSVELHKNGDRVAVTTSLGLQVDSGNQLVLDGDGSTSALVLGADQDSQLYFDGSNTIFQSLFDGARLHFNLENDSGTNLAMLRMDPSGGIAGAATGPLVSILTPESVPDSNTTNFPQIGSIICYRDAAGAGSNLFVKCRTATSTYETIDLGTFT